MKKPHDMPVWLLDKWQEIADLLAELLSIPAALIMRTANQQMEVYITSNSDNNPYHVGDTEDWHGLYCETVIKSNKKLLVANALNDKDWDQNPDIKLGMISYLGFPILYPDHTPFGTICILDNKENHYSETQEKALLQFKNVIEMDLAFISSFEIKSSEMVKTIKEQQDLLEKNNKELLEAKEKAEEGNRLKTAFLQNISHEIRTPLNAVVGFADLLRTPDLSDDKREYFTSLIMENSDQLLSIVSDILTISALETKQETTNIENVNINTVLVNLENIYHQKFGKEPVQLIRSIPNTSSDLVIKTDKTKLNQIFSNLLNNAFKFTDKGTIEFGYKMQYDKIEFFVKDSGIGVPKKMQKEIFNRFTQTDETINQLYGGTGLGLSICKSFVELLGGQIWLESEPGKGSTFYFTIPNLLPS